MKKVWILLLTFFLLQGCTGEGRGEPATPSAPEKPPVTVPSETPAQPENPPAPKEEAPKTEPTPSAYANEIFQEVTVKKTGTDTFEVKGKARVFEGVVSYVVEDGHNELTEGSIQTSAGAPEWGAFSHTIQVKKAEPNTTLTLILFETSMKDGSRRMELILPLPEK
ncbi:sporulation protein [Brevibacillus nitrificans]|uniref:Sporulation protein n=1 Tax=Brevibacillus nitrificans TaxID=651560 RepID=A0A3M8DJ04_9BACL|nr:Gmad2 immunoglobulin-like domain-containing protein [Brevibacillus nitrificans]RNB88004.1 sporulation protein [Brevibacillus nitrificans]